MPTAIETPKHSFVWPRAWTANQAPHGCVAISRAFPGRIGGRRVLSWFTSQEHAPRILPCGCVVCVLCGNLLMWERPRRRGDGGHWWTFKADWLDRA